MRLWISGDLSGGKSEEGNKTTTTSYYILVDRFLDAASHRCKTVCPICPICLSVESSVGPSVSDAFEKWSYVKYKCILKTVSYELQILHERRP